MAAIRTALVGAGAMGGIMARSIAPTIESVAYTAVVDRDPARAGALAELLGAHPYPTLAAAVAGEVRAGSPLRAADLRLPHPAHRAGVEDAVALGLHVLVEKPLAVTAADLAALQDVGAQAAAAGLIVAVAENYPHLRAVRAAASALHDDGIGELLAIRTTRAYTLDGEWAASGWRQDGGAASGVLWDQGTHHTSLIRAVAGEVSRVAAVASRGIAAPGVETVTLQQELASGVAAQSLYCWGTPAVAPDTEAVLFGTTGRIELRVAYDSAAGAAELVRSDGSRSQLSPPEDYYASHGWILDDWAAAIRDGGRPIVGVGDAVEDARVVLAAIASLAAGGSPVDVASIDLDDAGSPG